MCFLPFLATCLGVLHDEMMQNGNTYSSAALCSAIKIPKMVCTLIPAASLSASENIHDQSPEQKNVTWHTTVGVMVHV